MAKYVDYKKMQEQLLKRTDGYAANVRIIYQRAFEEIIDLVKGTELEDGKPFSLSDYGYGEEVGKILRSMYSQIYQVIRGGVQKEWLTSNENNDGLVKSVFGEQSLDDVRFSKLFQRNKEAMDAFFARKSADGGLNLSQRVWKYTGMFRHELENTLDLAIGEGTPANRIAAKIKQYLDEPDKWYRRFRVKIGEDEDGNPVYGRKWKRRIWDNESDSYKWIDDNPKDYHPGKGVYRSSARNAQRLARTETNMAYRMADYERWQQLDFVIGIEIKRSNHYYPCTVCESLKGIYPKTFKWKGWHPNCRCFQVPVLAKDDEIEEMLEKILDGESTATVPCDGKLTKLPKHFTDWMDENESRISGARERGTLPYFIRDNERLINPPTAKEKTRIRRKEIQKEAFEKLVGTIIRNDSFDMDVNITKRGVKEWLNQPHEKYNEKNELLLSIKEVFKNAKYEGFTDYFKDNPMFSKTHVFTTLIGDFQSYILVIEDVIGKCILYSVSDSNKVLNGIK